MLAYERCFVFVNTATGGDFSASIHGIMVAIKPIIEKRRVFSYLTVAIMDIILVASYNAIR